MAPSRDDPFALQVTSDLMVKLTKVPEPMPKCQNPKTKQTQQSPSISLPKNNLQMGQNDGGIETPTTSGNIAPHDSYEMSSAPPQPESASNTHTQGHQTKHRPSIHFSPVKQETEETKIQTKDEPHTTIGNKLNEPIGGKETEVAKAIGRQHGLDTTRDSECERQENIESPKEDPMGHQFQKPNMSKPDHKFKHQGGLKDLVGLEDMHNKSNSEKIVSQNAKHEVGLPTSRGKNQSSPQREVKLDGNSRQQSGHVGHPTNICDGQKLDTNPFGRNEPKEEQEAQKISKIEPKGSTPVEQSMTSLGLGEQDLESKNTGKNLHAHDNHATESERRLDNRGIQQVTSEVEYELARRDASEQCVCPSGPQLEAKTNANNAAKTNTQQNTSNGCGEGEFWRRLGHGHSSDSSQRVPQAQLKELPRLKTGKQFLHQIESHISKEKNLDRRTDIGASIIQRAVLQATLTETEEFGEDKSEDLEYEATTPSPAHQSPPRIVDQHFPWPRKESSKAYDEKGNLRQRENYVPQVAKKEINIPEVTKKIDIKEVQYPETGKIDTQEIHHLDSKQVDQSPQDGLSRVLQQQFVCVHEKDTCIDCYKKNAQNPLECADAVRLYKECSQRIQKVAKDAYRGTTTCPS